MRIRLVSGLLFGLLAGCAVPSGSGQQSGVRLPNCNFGVFGRHPPVNGHTSGVVILVGR